MLTDSLIVFAKDPTQTQHRPSARTHFAPKPKTKVTEPSLFRYEEKMGSCLSVSVNIIQILSFGVQLLQAGPDLMGRIPAYVRGVCAWSRGMMREYERTA